MTPLTSGRLVRIRPATIDDLAPVCSLLRSAGLALNDVGAQFGPQYAVAEAANRELVGVAGVERYGTDGLFRSAAVAPQRQGEGIGVALTEDRIAWAKRTGVRSLYLLTTTAAAYWPRFGFVGIERDTAPPAIRASSEWSGGCPASAVAMKLDL